MSVSIREQILARINIALLNNTGAGLNVFRSRETSITREMAPAVVIMPSAEDDLIFSERADRHELVINVEIFGRGDPWDSLVDNVATDVHRLLMNDATLATLLIRIRKTGSKWDGEEADKTAGVLTMSYRLTYLTKASDIADANII